MGKGEGEWKRELTQPRVFRHDLEKRNKESQTFVNHEKLKKQEMGRAKLPILFQFREKRREKEMGVFKKRSKRTLRSGRNPRKKRVTNPTISPHPQATGKGRGKGSPD